MHARHARRNYNVTEQSQIDASIRAAVHVFHEQVYRMDVEGEIRVARAAYRSREFAAAMSSCRNILSIDEAHREAHELYALAALGNGDPQSAAEQLLRAVSRQPADWDLAVFASVALTRCDRRSDAIELLERALDRHPCEPRIAFQLAVTLQAAGRVGEAIGHYRTALRLSPGVAEIHNNLATALAANGEREAAVAALRAALQIDPHYVRALNNLGKTLQELKRPAEALEPLERAAALAPDSAEVRSNLGAAYRAAGKIDEAVTQYREAIRLRPELGQAHFNLGNALQSLGRTEAAIDSLRHAVSLLPQLVGAKAALAAACFAAARFAEAADALGQAVEQDPRDMDLRLALAQAQTRSGHRATAMATLRAALDIAPQPGMARWELALLLADGGDFFESLSLLQGLVQELPPTAKLHFDHGQVLAMAGTALSSRPHLERAAAQYEAALALDPDHALTRMHYGLVLHALGGREPDTREQIERAVALDPQLTLGWWRLASLRAERADWRDYPAMLSRLHELAEVDEAGVDPFFMSFLLDDPQSQLRCARKASRLLRGNAGLLPARKPEPSRRGGPCRRALRVAYVSPDLRAHPVGMSLVELLERHDRNRVEVVGIAFGPEDSGEYRARIRAACDQFHDVTGLTNPEAARLLRDLEVDIAVDLAGHTANARPLILKERPAPINVQYLGYPGSLGMPWFDYVIADRFVIPEPQLANYDESVVWLPECFFPSDTRQSIPDGSPTRTQAGLPEHAVVFCCFNQFVRIVPAQLDSWVRILKAVPDSVLWMRSGEPEAEANVRREAALRGLDPGRILFAPVLDSRAAHLERHRAADLYLDSFPYNGHSTARDALWAGLPVLTRSGKGFASRVAGSLLNTLGLPDLIAPDETAYESMAIALGGDAQRLAQLKRRLEQSRSASVLFDTARLAAHMEDAYEAMHARWNAGQRPTLLQIPARARSLMHS